MATFGVVQHADLDGVHANVFGHSVNLRTQHVGWNAVDGTHALGVLRRDGGDGGHAIAAQRTEGLEVGLDASATPAVRAGNREHAGVAWQGGRGSSSRRHR